MIWIFRLPAEKPDVETSFVSSNNPSNKVSKFLNNVAFEDHGNMVSRLCKMESVIEHLRAGKYIQWAKTCSKLAKWTLFSN